MAGEERFEFKTEIQELLHLIIHTLYTHREIFLRELLSNAVDALSKVQFETLTNSDIYDKEQPLEISIKLDKEKRFLTVEDTGIGMTRDQLIQQIGTIAHSGTKRFVQQLSQKGEKDNQFIGQFGVGFYSVFMVADRVSLETRSMEKDAQAVYWESDGLGAYTLRESEKRKRGTTITLHLKEDMDEFLEAYRIKNLVQKYSNYLPFPIQFEGERINQAEAIWRKNKKDVNEEEYKAFYKQIGFDFQDPLLWEHIHSEAPVQFKALIYIPTQAPFDFMNRDAAHGLKLYTQRVFIQDDCKSLLPHYLRFLKGVVDTEDIPLNVSRETIQNDVNILKINKVISKKIVDALTHLAENDAEKYATFWKQYGKFIKEGVHSEFNHRDKLLPLLRFASTKSESTDVSLKTYLERKVEGQKAIYYAYGDSLSNLRRSPHLEFFTKHGIEVLLVHDPMDDLILSQLGEYEEMKWINVESKELELPEALKAEEQESHGEGNLKDLADKVRSILQDKVQSVRYAALLTDSPCRFINQEGGVSHSVRKMMMNLDRDLTIPIKRDLELNPNHPFILKLAENLEAAQTESDIKILFHLASLYEGDLEDPRELADLILPKLT
ncbi:MAG: molecular chaperone HtpG [Acidobacteria bacterium]|nr:molecular chaperone HtpG [Acidobacteriota bacterium]